MKNLERSVDSLKTIYSIVIALAMGKSIETLANLLLGDKLAEFLTALPAFTAFILLVVPFYHGMNRHLDIVYLEREQSSVAQGALLFDLFVFFVEALLLFGIASIVNRGLAPFGLMALALIVDIIWATLSHWIHYKGLTVTVLRWMLINVGTMILGTLLYLTTFFTDEHKPLILTLLVGVRTIVDYIACWRFYFPPKDHDKGTNGA